MNFFFIVIYNGGGNLKIVTNIETGQAKRFDTRPDAKKYARMNCLGLYKIYEFHM